MKLPVKAVLILVLLLILQCLSEPGDGSKRRQDEKNLKRDEEIWGSCWYAALLTQHRRENRIIDNRDGTISLAEVYISGNDLCPIPGLGRQESITPKYYIKKCIQGQVYRTAENDCKGTGTADNYYGAQKFQWCANLNGCLDSELPALLECKNDKFKNLVWDSLFFYESESSSIDTFYILASYFRTRDDVPKSDSEYYWLSGYAYNMVNDFRNFNKSKTEFLYVFCNKGAKG